ncbi:eukaryotic translation initiation factor 4B3-like [Silene latifolia]|uniref:eukaryotic translation initiation factor 4B3-like n=1 Tax=Silene latifolia TaxID=37657 RepID=UPI003D788B09
MAATVSSVWSKPGAWALDSEQHEDELNSQHQLDLSAAAKLPSPPAADFPSLSAAVTTTKPKKKSKQTLSLAEFSNYKPPSASASADIVLPTGPRERTAEEIAESRRGGFRNYGGAERGDRDRPRVSREDRGDMGSSRADDADDWSKSKKLPSFGSAASDRDSGFSRADEVDDWSKGKKFGAERGERREKMGFFGSSRADDVDNWATTKRPTGPGAEVDTWGATRRDRKVGFEATGPGADVDNWVKNKDIASASASASGGGGRPRLNLQPRTLPVVADNKVSGVEVVEGGKPKGNPFGAARPREEVLKDKGQDWKEIEEKLEAVKMKDSSSFDSIGRRRGFGLAANRPDASADDRTSVRAWRKPDSISNAAAPSTTPLPSAETGEKGDEISGSIEKASEDN